MLRAKPSSSIGACREKRGEWGSRPHGLVGGVAGGWRACALVVLVDGLQARITELSQAVEEQAGQNERAQLLQTHPGVGPITALAFVLVIGEVSRFERSRKLTSYLGLIPSEDSSGKRRRLGAISKQGNTLLRTLLVEAGQSAARCDPELRRA